MLKRFKVQENQSAAVAAVEENMSNLTSASNEACASSVSNSGGGMVPHPQYNFVAAPNTQPQAPPKKKRNLPGQPDPESEVIALSPTTLMATNRFVCEICNKGFQRDQNLQLHRRGHNLPWKLKQRTNKDVIRKKVYVCPEVSCIHHEPSRALGDLTGIKKHFCRKHGEKKWKCDKCSKRYAVQSDWKAHSKTCGTKEYRCDCGTLFSRRDSFITHRAFCDALAQESTRAIVGNNNQVLSTAGTAVGEVVVGGDSSHHLQFDHHHHHHHHPYQHMLKKEQQTFSEIELPPWLVCPPPPLFHKMDNNNNPSSSISHHLGCPKLPPPLLPPPPPPQYMMGCSPHISATALLQKAAQMGATMSINTNSSSSSNKTCSLPAMLRPHKGHEPVNISTRTIPFGSSSSSTEPTVNLASREEIANSGAPFVNALVGSISSTPYTNKAATTNTSGPPSMLQDMMLMTSLEQDAFSGIFNTKKEVENDFFDAASAGGSGGGNGADNGMTTRDFLGLRPLSHTEIFLNIADLTNSCLNGSNDNPSTTTQGSWSHGL